MSKRPFHPRHFKRRGTTIALTAISGTTLIGFVALAVDMGMVYDVRVEAQRSADAGALAGAWVMLDEERVKGGSQLATVLNNTRDEAVAYAGLNHVYGSSPDVDPNYDNSMDGDVLLGHFDDPDDLSESMSLYGASSQVNAIRVMVRRDSVRNGPIPLLFAQVLGITSNDVTASAVAATNDGTNVVGYKITTGSGNAQLLPFALHVDSWNALLAATVADHDGYAYDAETGSVSGGADGVPEINLYPGGGTTKENDQDPQNQYWGPVQITPGNFGTVDIGNPNNSTADISRQILYGVNESDLSWFGGELKFGADGTLILNGDSGLSGGFKAELAAIIGQPRAIPLFSEVNGPGNNSMYTIVAFVGIRILYVKLTGKLSDKCVIVQPAVVVDETVITESGFSSGNFVFEPPRLVR